MTSATTLPFGGGELSSFDPLDANTIEATQAGTYNSSNARCSLSCSGYLTGCTSPTWPAASTFWFHGLHYADGTFYINTSTPLFFYNATVPVFKIVLTQVNTSTYSCGFWTLQGVTMTLVGSFSLSTGTLNTLDIKLVGNTSNGVLQVYSAGTLRLSVSGLNHTGFTGVDQIGLYGQGLQAHGDHMYHSEIICDSVNHIGDSLITYPIDTVSATNTGWNGAVSTINKIVLTDSTFAFAASANLISTYYANGFSLGGKNIVAVLVTARAKCDASGPQNLQLAVRTSATNYVSATIALQNGYQACSNPWTTNPNTSAAWLAAAAQALEGGQKSIT